MRNASPPVISSPYAVFKAPMPALKFFNHQWDEVYMWRSSKRYYIDDHGNCFVKHDDPNQEPWIELLTVDGAREMFVDLIHKGWQQRKVLGSLKDELFPN